MELIVTEVVKESKLKFMINSTDTIVPCNITTLAIIPIDWNLNQISSTSSLINECVDGWMNGWMDEWMDGGVW